MRITEALQNISMTLHQFRATVGVERKQIYVLVCFDSISLHRICVLCENPILEGTWENRYFGVSTFSGRYAVSAHKIEGDLYGYPYASELANVKGSTYWVFHDGLNIDASMKCKAFIKDRWGAVRIYVRTLSEPHDYNLYRKD